MVERVRVTEKRLGVMEALHERGRESGHGWTLDTDITDLIRWRAAAVIEEGLAELADQETLAELSAQEQRPVGWAARLTPYGGDALLYARARGKTMAEPAPAKPGPSERLVRLLPAQMTALRVYTSLADELAAPPARGLAERVEGAGYNLADNRWHLCLTEEQIESVAYALHLHMLATSSNESNRFARDHRRPSYQRPNTPTRA